MKLFLGIGILLCCPVFKSAAQSNLLLNPGFEKGSENWKIQEKDPMSTISAEAARKGSNGLRVVDKSAELGSGVMSDRFPVRPGQKAKIEFWAKTTDEKFIGVNLVFFAKDKAWTTDSAEKLPGVAITDFSGKWKKYEFEVALPDYVDAVAIWVHSWSASLGSADFDDFELKIK